MAGSDRPGHRTFAEALACALRGTRLAAATQRHFRAHLGIAGGVLLAAAALGVAPAEFGVLALACGLVLAAELANTAIERLTDLVAPGADRRAGAVKDLAAATVLLASAGALAAGAFVLLPHLWPGTTALLPRLAALAGALCLGALAAAAAWARR